jgi:hypothetical protein
MSDEADTVATWVYGPSGESKLIDLAKGASAPKGWAFEPPSGVVVEVEGNAGSSPPTPINVQGSSDQKFADLYDRLQMVEFKLASVMERLDAVSQPVEPAPANPKREALVARAKELKLEFHNRLGDAKLEALIAEAEAAQTPVDGE